MNRYLLHAILFVELLCWGLGGIAEVSAVNYRTLYVRTTGNDSNNGLSPSTAFKTIQKAATIVNANDRVYVGAGTYQPTGEITFRRAGQMNGYRDLVAICDDLRNGRNATGGASPIAWIADRDGAKTGDAGEVIMMAPRGKSNWLFNVANVEGYAFLGFKFVEDPGTLRYIRTDANNGQHDTATYGYRSHGIYGYQVNNLIVADCEFIGHDYSVHTHTCDNVLITNNRVTNARYMAFYPYWTRNVTITDCQLAHSDRANMTWQNYYLLYGWQSSMTVRRVRFDSSATNTEPEQYGIQVYSGGHSDKTTEASLDVEDCDFIDASYHAYYASWNKAVRCVNSRFPDARYAIHAHGDSPVINGNTLTIPKTSRWWKQNSWGIILAGEKVTSTAAWGQAGFASTFGTAECKNNVVKGYHLGIQSYNERSVFSGTEIEGRGTDPYLYDADGNQSNNPDWTYSYGLYLYKYYYRSDFNDTSPWVSRGCEKFRYSDDLGLKISQVGRFIHYSETDLTLDRATVTNCWEGVHGYGPLTVKNSTFKDIPSWGLYGWLCPTVNVTATAFNNVGNGPLGKGGWAWAMLMYGRKLQTDFEKRHDTTDYWNGQAGNSTLLLDGVTADGCSHGFHLVTYKNPNVTLRNNRLRGTTARVDDSSPWTGYGHGVYLANGNYTLQSSEFDIEGFYHGLYGYYNTGLIFRNQTVQNNVYGLWMGYADNVEVTNCKFKNIRNACVGIHKAKATITGCEFDSSGWGVNTSWSDITFRNSTITNVNKYGHGFGGDRNFKFVASNINSSGGYNYGAYFWENEDVSLDNIVCENNRTWGLVAYVDYYRTYWKDEYSDPAVAPWQTTTPGNTPWTKITTKPLRGKFSVTNSQFNGHKYGGGVHMYSYEPGASWTLQNIVANDNISHGIYQCRGSCLDNTTQDLRLSLNNNWCGIYFDYQSAAFDGSLRGINLDGNAHGLIVTYADLSMKNLTMSGSNGWGVYHHGFYETHPSYGTARSDFLMENCTIDGSGVITYYPSSVVVANSVLRNARFDREFTRDDGWYSHPKDFHGFYSWRSRVTPDRFDFTNVVVENASQIGMYANGYTPIKMNLSNVVVRNNYSHGALLYRAETNIENCKFQNNGNKSLTTPTENWYAYGLLTQADYYDFDASLWKMIPDAKATIKNCEFTGNGCYAFGSYYADLAVSDSLLQNNGAGGWCYKADATFNNVRAIDNYREFVNAEGVKYYWGNAGLQNHADGTVPVRTLFKKCTATGNYWVGIYSYGLHPDSYTKVEDCNVSNNRGTGLHATWLPQIDINRVTANGNSLGWGINVNYASATLTDCTASNNGLETNRTGGIYLHGGYWRETAPDGSSLWYHAALFTEQSPPWDETLQLHRGTDVNQYNQFIIRNCVASGNAHSGIYAQYGTYQIENVQANDNYYYGILAYNGPKGDVLGHTVKNCNADRNGNWCILTYNTKAVIEDCTTNSNYGWGGLLLQNIYQWNDTRKQTVKNVQVTGSRYHGLQAHNVVADFDNFECSRNGYNSDGSMYWGGAYATSGEFTFVNSKFEGNTAYGLEVWRSPKFTMENCRLRSNRYYGLLNYENDSSLVKNCLVVDNGRGVYSRMRNEGVGTYWNVTIANNRWLANSYSEGLGVYHDLGGIDLRNCIIAGNKHYGIYRAAGNVTQANNLLADNGDRDYAGGGVSAGPGAIHKPPRFLDPVGGDFHLSKGSPAINAGGDASGIVDVDMDGVGRPLFKAWEIGAYEYTQDDASVRILSWEEQK